MINSKEQSHEESANADANYITRKVLSQKLGVSEKYLSDNPLFQQIESRIGRKSFYSLRDVQRVFEEVKGRD